jgi:hypothetical protein
MRTELMARGASRPAACRRRPGAVCRVVPLTPVLLVAVVSLMGCGGRKSGLTIADRLRRAESQATPEGRAREYTKVARLQAQTGDRAGAEKTVGRARQVYLELRLPAREPANAATAAAPAANAAQWGPLLVEMASVYTEAGSRGPARDVLKEATTVATGIGDDVSRAAVLAGIGGAYGSETGGDAALARTHLEQAAAIAAGVEPRFRAEALAAVALGYVQAGLAGEAGGLVATLEQTAREVESPRARAEGLAAAANVRARTGDAAAAARLLGEAAAAAQGIGAAENRTYALVAVALATAASGQHREALGLLGEAATSAHRVPDPDAQKNAVERVRQVKAEIERRR